MLYRFKAAGLTPVPFHLIILVAALKYTNIIVQVWAQCAYLIQSQRWSCHRWGPSALFQQWWMDGPWRGPLHWAPGGDGDGGPLHPLLPGPCGCGKHKMLQQAAGRASTLGRQSPLRGPQGQKEEASLWELLDRKEIERKCHCLLIDQS